MPTKRLTAQTIDHAKPPESGRAEIWDTVEPGFGLRISATGAKSYFVTYRLDGKKVRQTLGKPSAALPLSEARQRAARARTLADAGRDPRKINLALSGDALEADARAKAAAPDSYTLADLIDRYIRLHGKTHWKPATHVESERILRTEILPTLGGNTAPVDIARADIAKMIDDKAKDAPFMANRIRTHAAMLFNWAVQRGEGGLIASPASGISSAAREAARERVLTDGELVAIWTAADKLAPVFRDFVRILILTGQRRSQVAGMRRQDVDLEAGLWLNPGTQTKSGRAHTLPLSTHAVETIKGRPTIVGCGLFFSTNGKTPISGFSKLKAALDEKSGVAEWRFHDLRRTVATGLSRLGVARYTVERILDHTDRTVTAIYDRHQYLPEMRRALDAWEAALQRLLAGQPFEQPGDAASD